MPELGALLEAFKDKDPKSLKDILILATAVTEAEQAIPSIVPSEKLTDARKAIQFELKGITDGLKDQKQIAAFQKELDGLYATLPTDTPAAEAIKIATIRFIDRCREVNNILKSLKDQTVVCIKPQTPAEKLQNIALLRDLIKHAVQLKNKMEQEHHTELAAELESEIRNRAGVFVTASAETLNTLLEMKLAASQVRGRGAIEMGEDLGISEKKRQQAMAEERNRGRTIVAETFITLYHLQDVDNTQALIDRIGLEQAYLICQNFISESEVQTQLLNSLAEIRINQALEQNTLGAYFTQLQAEDDPAIKTSLAKALLQCSQSDIQKANPRVPVLETIMALIDTLPPEEARNILSQNKTLDEPTQQGITAYLKEQNAKLAFRYLEYNRAAFEYEIQPENLNKAQTSALAKRSEQLRDGVQDAIDFPFSADSKPAALAEKELEKSGKLITQNAKKVGKHLNKIADRLDPKSGYIETLVKNRDQNRPLTMSQLGAGGKAVRLQFNENDRTEIRNRLLEQKGELITILQNMTTSLCLIHADDPEPVYHVVDDIIAAAGAANAYEVFASHPDRDSKIIFACELLNNHLDELTGNQIEKLVDAMAMHVDYPPEIYSDLFLNPPLKDKNRINEVRDHLARAILKSPNMLNWLWSPAMTKKQEKLDALMNALTEPSALNVFSHAPDLEPTIDHLIVKDLQVSLIKHAKHFQSLFDDKHIAQTSYALRHWSLADFKAEIDHPVHGNEMRWAMYTRPNIVQNLIASSDGLQQYIEVIAPLDFKKLSAEKIKLLDKKVRIGILQSLDSWVHDKEKISPDKAKALVHDLNFDEIYKSESSLCLFFGTDPDKVIDYLEKEIKKCEASGNTARINQYRALARRLLTELAPNGYWSGRLAEDDSLIHKLVVMGVYKLENQYDLTADKDKLKTNPLVKGDIKRNWEGNFIAQKFFTYFINTASPAAFKLVFTTPLLTEGLSFEAIKNGVEQLAKDFSPGEYLHILNILMTTQKSSQNAAERQQAERIIGDLINAIPTFLQYNKRFSRSDIAIIKQLIQLYRQNRAVNYSISAKDDPIISALEKNENKKSQRALGMAYFSEPYLLSSFLKQAENFQATTFYNSVWLKVFVGGAVLGTIATAVGMIWKNFYTTFLPTAWTTSTIWSKITNLSGAGAGLLLGGFLGIGQLFTALNIVTTGGTIATIAGAIFTAAAPLIAGAIVGGLVASSVFALGKGIVFFAKTLFQYITNKPDQNEVNYNIMRNGLKYTDPVDLHQAIYRHQTTKDNFAKMYAQLKEQGYNLDKGLTPEVQKLVKPITDKYKFENRYYITRVAIVVFGFLTLNANVWGGYGLWGSEKQYQRLSEQAKTLVEQAKTLLPQGDNLGTHAKTKVSLNEAAASPDLAPPAVPRVEPSQEPDKKAGEILAQSLADQVKGKRTALPTDPVSSLPSATFPKVANQPERPADEHKQQVPMKEQKRK